MEHQTQQLVDISDEEIQKIKLQIEQWKDEYGSIYITEFEDGSTFIWRPLSKREFDKAMEYYEDPLERAEYVCRLCVLDPTDIDYSNDMIAGIPEILTENILRESGFTADSKKVEELMAKYEQEMNLFSNQIPCVIVEAFPYFDIQEVESWTLDKMIWYYSRAKWVLEVLRGIELVQEEPGGTMAPDGTIVKGDPRDFPELFE